MTRTLRRLSRLAVSGLFLLSLLACIGTGWLWWRGNHVRGRFTFRTPQGTYTLYSDSGRLDLVGPPPAGPAHATLAPLVAAIRNEDVEWTPFYPKGQEGSSYGILPNARPGTATQALEAYPWRVLAQSAARPLLEALEDPGRAAAAHALLARSRGYWAGAQSVERDVTLYGGLPLRLLSFGPEGVRADPSQLPAVARRWHERLDVPVASASHWQVIDVAALPPLLWLGLWLRRAILARRRRMMGLCVACGYDLRASGDRCPECGTSAPVPLPIPPHP